MRMIDGGDEDDKLIAVLPGSSFDGMTLADLEAAGVTSILKTWFESYKGPGEIVVTRFEGLGVAEQVLQEAMTAYQASR
jgi:inorganic pyrophosphatase